MLMNEKEIPVLYKNKTECCSCSACFSSCPTSSIMMEEDIEGFLYPIINENSCVKCNLCLKVCPVKHNKVDKI